MAQKPNLKTDNFISKIVSDPKQVPETLMLSGFLGASSEDKHTRLYFDAQLSSYVEIPDEGILHTQDYPADASPLGGSYVWIKKDAMLIHGKVNSERTKAKFLEGPIVNDFGNIGGFDLGGNYFDTTIFNPPSYVGSPACGHTSNSFCTRLGCQVTEQAYCPKTIDCPTRNIKCIPTSIWNQCPPPPPPPPVSVHQPVCPSVIALCNSQVCEMGYNDFVNPQAQQLNQPQALKAITVPWQVCQTLNYPICNVTHSSPLCPTQANALCPTKIPAICPTKIQPWCPTRLNYPPCNLKTIVAPNCPIITHNPPCHIITATDPKCFITRDNSPVCNPVVTVAGPICDTGGLQSRICPSVAACPSVAGCPSEICGGGFDFGGNPIQY